MTSKKHHCLQIFFFVKKGFTKDDINKNNILPNRDLSLKLWPKPKQNKNNDFKHAQGATIRKFKFPFQGHKRI